MAFSVHAALIERGGGLIYDTELDVTWLQDANFANTSNYTGANHLSGRMQWEDAMTWAENLVYQGYTDWRLPEAVLEDGSPCTTQNNCRQTEALHLFVEEGIGLLTPGPFINLKGNYWSQTENQFNSSRVITYTSSGTSEESGKSSILYAMAIRDGDSAPEPDETNNDNGNDSGTNEDGNSGNIIGCFVSSLLSRHDS